MSSLLNKHDNRLWPPPPAVGLTLRHTATAADRRPAAIRLLVLLTAQWPEERLHLMGQRLRLFHRGEMAALWHLGPAPDIGVGARRQRARRADNFAWKSRISSRYSDGMAFRDRPGFGSRQRKEKPPFPTLCAGAQGRDNCPGELRVPGIGVLRNGVATASSPAAPGPRAIRPPASRWRSPGRRARAGRPRTGDGPSDEN
jgi:hypothetical protein